MIGFIEAVVWIVTAVGALFCLATVPGRLPRPVAFALFAVAEVAVLASVAVDVVLLARGWRTPDLPTHIGYLLSLPFIAPAGLALTYKKLDRWGLLIIGVATLIAAIMVVRQLQTLGVPYGYVNVTPVPAG